MTFPLPPQPQQPPPQPQQPPAGFINNPLPSPPTEDDATLQASSTARVSADVAAPVADSPASDFTTTIETVVVDWSRWGAVFNAAPRIEQLRALELLNPMVKSPGPSFPVTSDRAEIAALVSAGVSPIDIGDRIVRHNNAASMAGAGTPHIDIASLITADPVIPSAVA